MLNGVKHFMGRSIFPFLHAFGWGKRRFFASLRAAVFILDRPVTMTGGERFVWIGYWRFYPLGYHT